MGLRGREKRSETKQRGLCDGPRQAMRSMLARAENCCHCDDLQTDRGEDGRIFLHEHAIQFGDVVGQLVERHQIRTFLLLDVFVSQGPAVGAAFAHPAVMLADGKRAIVGSINLAPGSFDPRRELAIEVGDDDCTERLHKVAQHDWENSRPLDLSDEGLLADLEKRYADSAEKLALGEHHFKHK